jgi:hypothetical protein
MAATGITEAQYREFLASGGRVVVQLDKIDVFGDTDVEQSPFVAPYLDTGFEIKPSPVLETLAHVDQIDCYGDPWSRVVAIVYRNGGSIVYKRLSPGKYEATLSLPAKG